MISSRLTAAFTHPSCSRCFRTDAEGRIAIQRDWPALFGALQALDAIAIQSRHSYARLIHLGRPPEIIWDDAGERARDEHGALQFRADRWGGAWGRLEICACCDSPGHVEIQNARGGDILQLCATTATSPVTWSACLEKIAAPSALDTPDTRLTGFPLLPDGLHPLRESVDALPAFLAALGREEAAIDVLLRTPEVAHRRAFVPRRVTGDCPLMVATDGRTTLQLALSPVQGLACATDRSLHLAGPGNTLLLSLAAGNEHLTAWRAALAAAFPSSRSFLSTP